VRKRVSDKREPSHHEERSEERRDGGDDVRQRLGLGKPCLQRRPLVPLIVNLPDGQLSFLSTIVHFGTSEDVTVRDLRLELLFPADDPTRTALHAMAG